MPTIKSVELFLVELPLRRDHRWTGLTERIGRYLITRVSDDEGRVGWGEAPALKDWGGEFGRHYGESVDIVRMVIEKYLAPVITGIELGNILELHRRMDATIKGYPYAKAAIDIAVYDLTAQWLGIPVFALLGGRVTKGVRLTHSIGLLPAEEACAEARKVVSEGVNSIKIKVGTDARRDIDVVRAIRAALGDEVSISIDANGGYETPGDAIAVARELEGVRLRYFEQPVSGLSQLNAVASYITVPVMADESAWTAHDAFEIASAGSVQMVSIYVTKSGGLYRAMQVAAVCNAGGIVCNVNGSAETGIGNLANVHLALAAAVSVPSVIPVSTPAEFQHGQMAGIFYRDDLLVEPMQLVEGCIEIPHAPGLGIKVDVKKIERYRVDS